jgi:predicted  nucleic acid-binding Zn-ribbon protein
MKAQLKALYELQQIDLQLTAARKALAALDNGTLLRQHVAQAEKNYSNLSELLRKSESELQDSELKLKSIETKRDSFQKKLYEGQVTNPKELSSIEKEIEMLGKSRAQLDERLLELYDIVERQQAEAKKSEETLTKLKQRTADHTAQYQAKSREINSQIEQLTASREKALATVTDVALLKRYETVRTRHQDTGLARVENSKCGGCHISVTTYTQRLLKEGEQHQTCESCGRILFLDE